jgi:subtilisin family serine protease
VQILRVFPCSGASSNGVIVGAIDAATQDHVAKRNLAVINMSLGGGASPATDQAVARATQAGVVVAVSAGNSNTDACSGSPARAPSALTVAASDSMDQRARFSSFGSCVDLFAPGVAIQSLDSRVAVGNAPKSGTSMSAPHVAGAAALVLQANPTFTPDQVAQELKRLATRDVIGDPQGSPNLLLRVPN